MNRPHEIYVHCTATPPGREVSAAEIDRWHRERGWSGIGYHAVVKANGVIEKGRDTNKDGDPTNDVGAHCYGHNINTLAVVYVGGVDAHGRASDTRTAAQTKALIFQVRAWMKRFGIPVSRVFGHYERDPGKACPSFDMEAFRKQIEEKQV